MSTPAAALYRTGDRPFAYALLRRFDDFGLPAVDLVRPPSRFWAGSELTPPAVELHIDARRTTKDGSPTDLLQALPQGETWRAMSRRSLARLMTWFLVCEDPQRRLDAEPVVTLAHQASLVQHVLLEPGLQRVLIADEVGLGKTIEAGLVIRELLKQQPGLRVLYLAPARLVSNVRREFERLGLTTFRSWVAGSDRDGSLADPKLIASIHRAAHEGHFEAFTKAPPWDVIVVDEAHHLSAWGPGGGGTVQKYRLVQELQERLSPQGRLILMSGTPHQGHPARFENLLGLLKGKEESDGALAGRVIYRTKDDVRDWEGRPLFPGRQVNLPLIVDLGVAYQHWLEHIHAFFEPSRFDGAGEARRRAAGWRAGQALQWATSSVQAGLGYLVRQAVRAGWEADGHGLKEALEVLRPYRGGPDDEKPEDLFARMSRDVKRQDEAGDLEDVEDPDEVSPARWRPDPDKLKRLLEEGVALHAGAPDAKWIVLQNRILKEAAGEKVVLFAQPIETVTALARFLERTTGRRPAQIVGDQKEAERASEIEAFWRDDGPQYLVSSGAGGEGINLQVARRLVHLDVPWNPMEMEQRVGRVHRFLSKRTVIVDTLVVKDSREVDAYQVARGKLREISRVLVSDDRFEALFSRVMSLVAPEELQDILAERPVGPLTEDERRRVSELVTQGFDRWRSFHSRFADQRKKIQGLDPGQATWDDLGRFAESHLDAKQAAGFSALQFRWEEGEVREEEGGVAQVLEIDGQPFACGDYAGMPVTSAQGVGAGRLGLNIPAVADRLRAMALPERATGAAQLRWPSGRPLPAEGLKRPFGLLALVRQSLRNEQATWLEAGLGLQLWAVDGDGAAYAIEGDDKGRAVRALMDATVRTDPEENAQPLQAALAAVEERFMDELRRPSESDREHRVAHAVTPLFAAVIA